MIPASGCPPWPPDHPRTLPRTGTPTPPRGARPAAKALLTGLILYAVCHEQPQDRTLATVRDYLSLNPENFRGLLKLMQDSTAAVGLIARAANRHLSKADREAAGVLSSAQRHTHFLDSPRMAAVTARSDFAFADLKAQTAT